MDHHVRAQTPMSHSEQPAAFRICPLNVEEVAVANTSHRWITIFGPNQVRCDRRVAAYPGISS